MKRFIYIAIIVISFILFSTFLKNSCYSEDSTSDTVILNKIVEAMHPHSECSLNISGDLISGFYQNMGKNIKKDEEIINEIIDYALISDDNFNLCYNYLSNIITDFNRRFGRDGKPSEKDWEFINKCIKGEHFDLTIIDGREYCDIIPDFGKEFAVYLLIELTKKKNDKEIFKETIFNIYNLYISSCLLEMRTYKKPSEKNLATFDFIKRENKNPVFNPYYNYGCILSYEIAYFCDLLMEEIARSDNYIIDEKTRQICKEFLEWKNDWDASKKDYNFLKAEKKYQYKDGDRFYNGVKLHAYIMEYVKRIIDNQ